MRDCSPPASVSAIAACSVGEKPLALGRRVAPQINDMHAWKRRAAMPRRENEALEARALGVGRRSPARVSPRRESIGTPSRCALHDGHIARLIAQALFLLEALVVLLVDDDKAEFGEGEEQGRARADDDICRAFGDRAPGAAARQAADFRVPQNRRPAKAGGKALQELSGERDLREKDQRLVPATHRLRRSPRSRPRSCRSR